VAVAAANGLQEVVQMVAQAVVEINQMDLLVLVAKVSQAKEMQAEQLQVIIVVLYRLAEAAVLEILESDLLPQELHLPEIQVVMV
jgi:hypothetical protein